MGIFGIYKKLTFTLLTKLFLSYILYIVYLSQSNRGDFLKIVISNRSGVPIYEQIKEQIKEAIFSGELREDEMLPSMRVLARDLKISVITTTRAYNDLAAEGFVANVQGKGCFVLPRNAELAAENALAKIEEGLAAIIETAKTAGLKKTDIEERLNILWEETDE
jgi:GntR family transcriptional regulator